MKIVFVVTKIFSKIVSAYNDVHNKILLVHINSQNNIRVEKDITLRGCPIIDIRKGCHLEIGKGVTLNSSNRGYHINMHSPVKLFADRPGARIRIGDNARIHGSCIHAYSSISIGKNCLIAANCQIIDGHGHDLSFPDVANRLSTKGGSQDIEINDNVWIGANTIILPGVRIGSGSVISANSVVVKDVPPMVVAGGNPAVIIQDFRENAN